MNRPIRKLRLSIMLVLLLSVIAMLASTTKSTSTTQSQRQGGDGVVYAAIQAPQLVGVSQAVSSDTSPALRDIPPRPARLNQKDNDNDRIPNRGNYNAKDTVRQSVLGGLGALAMPTPIVTWDGMYNQWGPIPPDTNGDVGLTQYVQSTNSTGLQVFNKNTGASILGPITMSTLWSGFGGLCETYNNGDPVVLYDPMANRWLVTQFAYTTTAGPTYQCIAVSTTSDATGSYHRYAFISTNVGFDDYPHYGVWPDAYYMTANGFNHPSGFVGANVAYERDRMLVGDPTARMVSFEVVGDGGALPADMDGLMPPPAGSPNYIWYPTANGLINEYKFHVDWTNPANSTLTGPFAIPVAMWDDDLCAASREMCIDQPIATTRLEAIADRFMHRLAYRNFGTHESIVANHTVDGSGTGIAGIRWYEVRDPNGARTVFQQGTYAPADGTHRWMGSISMDGQGNIAAGYSVSSLTIHPSIRYAGRLVTDPPGQFAQGEATMFNGTGSEDFPGTGRWGDYSSLNVDPVDDCTFYYTTEYFAQTGLRNWRTRIGSFKFPGCANVGATHTPTALPTATATVCPIQFSDVPPGHTFYESVHCLACRGIVSGYADGTFRPNNPVTRGQLAKMVSNAAGFFEDPNPQIFTDVPPGHTFYDFINRLTRRGHMTGYQCGGPGEPCINGMPYFRPFANATRGQTSKIVSNAAGFTETHTTQTFEDVPPTQTFYQEIERLASRGVMGGYPCGSPGEPCVPPGNRPYFRPNNDVTRGQSAKIVANTFFPNCQPRVPTPTAVVPTATSTVCPGGIRETGAITTTDLVQMGRVAHSDPTSRCEVPKSCAALESPARPRHYDRYDYTNNTGAAQCVTVQITQNCGDNAARSIAYLGTFDPTNLCANYLADGGSAGPSYSYSFNLPAGSTAVVVVYENSPNIGCAEYTITINPCQVGQPTFTPMPTNTPVPTNTPTITPTAGACTYLAATATATFIPGGTRVDGAGCDDCTVNVTLPFPINVYGTSASSVDLGSNGEAQFTTGNPKLFFWDGCLPIDPGQGGPLDRTVFLYYDDLLTVMTGTNTCPGCGIYTQTLGSAPNRQFVVRWNTTYFNHNGEANFEMLLTEGSNDISVIYGTSDNNGAEAVAGIQRDTTVYTQFSCNQPVLVPGLRINYIPQNCAVMPKGVTSP